MSRALLALPRAWWRSTPPPADIYKCVDGGATSYQAMPCARGQARRVPVRIAEASPQVARERTPPRSAVASGADRASEAPGTRTAVELGISDDEVLNMPGWGRPTQIVAHAVAARVAGGVDATGTATAASASCASSTRGLPTSSSRRPRRSRGLRCSERGAGAACAYMLDTRPPIGMQPATSSAMARQTSSFRMAVFARGQRIA